MQREIKKNQRKNPKKRRYNAKKLTISFLVTAIIIYFVYAMIWQQVMISKKNEEIEALSQKIEEAAAESEKLRQEVEDLSNPEYIERIARERLGLVRPNERVFVDSNKSEDNQGN